MNRKNDGILRQFKRIAISFSDFEEAHNIVSYINRNDIYSDINKNFLVLSVLTNAMIISYCRPFSGNDSRNNVKVPDLKSSALKILSPDELSFHNFLMQRRNQLIAHSDSQAIDIKFVIHTYEQHKMIQPVRNRSSIALNHEQLKMFKNLSQKLLSYVANLRKEMEPEVLPLLTEEDIEEQRE